MASAVRKKAVMALGVSLPLNQAAERSLIEAGYYSRCFLADQADEAKKELLATPYDLVIFGGGLPVKHPELKKELEEFLKTNSPTTRVHQVVGGQGPPTPEAIAALCVSLAQELKD